MNKKSLKIVHFDKEGAVYIKRMGKNIEIAGIKPYTVDNWTDKVYTAVWN